jgi:hypothetical protein
MVVSAVSIEAGAVAVEAGVCGDAACAAVVKMAAVITAAESEMNVFMGQVLLG